MLAFILKHLTFALEMIPLQILIVLPVRGVGGVKEGGYKKGGTLMFIAPVFI